jgi:hypothetical protein
MAGYGEGDEIERILFALSGGDPTRRDAVYWEVEAEVARKWMDLHAEEKLEKMRWDLRLMELHAAFHHVRWNAPNLGGATGRGGGVIGGYCQGVDVGECRGIYGKRLADYCRTCPN